MSNPEMTLMKAFCSGRKQAILAAEKERENIAAGKKPWGIYNTSLSEHESTFLTLFIEELNVPSSDFLKDRRPISDFLKKQKEKTGHAFILDVMGQAGYYDQLPFIDGELAITLNDFRSEEQKLIDASYNMEVIDADVLKGKTWKRVEDYKTRNKNIMNNGFDLIICRPALGWTGISPVFDIVPSTANQKMLLLTRKFIEHTSPNGGTILLRTGLFSGAIDKRFTEYLKSDPRLTVISGTYDFRITRRS